MPNPLPLLALPLTLLCVGCAYTVTTPPASCSSLVPKPWIEGVEGYPVPRFPNDPPADVELREWQKAFVGQSGQLEKANGRTADTVAIYENCERLINESRPRKKLLGFL